MNGYERRARTTGRRRTRGRVPGGRSPAGSRRPPTDRREAGFGLVEALIAVTILVIGLLAVAGLTLATAAQVQLATVQGGQTMAAQQVLEELQLGGFAAAASGVDTVSVDGRDYEVTVTVTTASARVKNVQATVAGVGSLGTRTVTTRLYKPRPLPSGP